MKNLIKKISGALLAAMFFINDTLAQGDLFRGAPGRPDASAPGTLGSNITTMINYFLGLLGLIAVAFLIYAGVLMVTAGGNDEQVTKAKKIIMYAAAGIVIVLLSYTIVTFVAGALG